MLCRACGMDSRTPGVCEWCKKPLNGTGAANQGAAPAPALNAPSLNAPTLNAPSLHAPINVPVAPPLNAPAAPSLHNAPPAANLGQTPAALPMPDSLPQPAPTARIQRTTLTGEVIEVPTSGEPTVQSAPGMFAPPDPNATTVITPHGAYAGAPYAAMNMAGASYQTMAPQMLRDEAGMPQASLSEKWELFLAIAAPLLLLSAWLVHQMPHLVMWVGFFDLFVLSLAMGATGAVPSYDDSYFDVTVMLVVTFMFGPLIALVVYLITAAIKQECNTAVVGMLALQVIVFQGMTLAFASNTAAMKHVGAFMLFGFMQFFAVFIAFLGWLLSSFFRPVGE